MENSQCLGCKTSFQEGEDVPRDSGPVEFKHHAVPLREDHVKWGMLKAIVSFLNSSGGTIYVGIEPTPRVRGLFLERKERDSFKLTLKQLMEKIYPKVDLNDRQQVEVHYVPVFRGDNFEGKFIVKILVQQGDPTQVYCISEKIKLVEENSNKTDELEVYYTYESNKLGATTELKGFELMNLIFEKARNTNKVTAFHQGCNPEPPYLELQIRTLRFTNLDPTQYKLLEITYLEEFEKMQIDFSSRYDKEDTLAEIEFEEGEDFDKIKTYVVDNISYLDAMFQDTVSPTFFVVRGEVQHVFQIHNNFGQKMGKERKNEKKETYKQSAPKFPYQERIAKKEEVKKITESVTKRIYAPKVEETEKEKEKEKPRVEQKGTENVIIFTHIAPQSIDSLEKYLQQSVCKKLNKKFAHYFNTLEMQLGSEKELQNYLVELYPKEAQLASYGFKREIRYGICENKLKICNVDWNKNKELKVELQAMMKLDVVEMKNCSNSLVCEMKSRELTCEWLDRLLDDRPFKKKYSNKGAGSLKMKIYIEVAKIYKN